jgi:hypothetical protein
MTGTGGAVDPRPVSPWDRGRGGDPSRLGRMRLLAGFAVVLGVILIGAAVVSIAAEPPEPPPDCAPGEACGGPPPQEPAPSDPSIPRPPADVQVGIRAGEPWKSTELGYEFEYDDTIWAIEREDGRGVEFRLEADADIDASLVVTAAPAAEAGVEVLANRRLEAIQSSVADLEVDDRGRYAILGPAIGYVDGIGGSFAGSVVSPQGAATPVGVSLLAASDGRTTVVITLIVSNPDKHAGADSLQRIVREGAGELIVKTFRWAPAP